jgi:hypothetical protein
VGASSIYFIVPLLIALMMHLAGEAKALRVKKTTA